MHEAMNGKFLTVYWHSTKCVITNFGHCSAMTGGLKKAHNPMMTTKDSLHCRTPSQLSQPLCW